MRVSQRVLEAALFALALIGLGGAALAWLDATIFEVREGPRLESRLGEGRPGRPSPGAAGARDAAAAGHAWGRLEIPAAGVSSLVVDGVDADDLRVAAGHLPDSAFPGENGNVALAGHRDSVFSGLKNVLPGHDVRLLTPDGTFDYEVQWVAVVPPTKTDVLGPTDEPTLTLVTCFPFSYVGRAPLRYVVRASRAKAPPAPAERENGNAPIPDPGASSR